MNKFARQLRGSRSAAVPKKKGPEPQRACTLCGKMGHNRRSHEPGGKFYAPSPAPVVKKRGRGR